MNDECGRQESVFLASSFILHPSSFLQLLAAGEGFRQARGVAPEAFLDPGITLGARHVSPVPGEAWGAHRAGVACERAELAAVALGGAHREAPTARADEQQGRGVRVEVAMHRGRDRQQVFRSIITRVFVDMVDFVGPAVGAPPQVVCDGGAAVATAAGASHARPAGWAAPARPELEGPAARRYSEASFRW